MKLNTLYVVFAMVTIGLAGCIGGGGDDLQTANDDPSGPAEVTEDTGGLSGTVTDEEGLPVEGAQVALQSPGKEGLETTTDESGFFSFSNVAPGTWQLFIQKLGFDSVGRQVSVNAGQVTEVQEALAAVAVEEPHAITQIQDGNIQCSIRFYPGVPLTGIVAPGWYTGVAVCAIAPIPTLPEDKFLLSWEIPEENANEVLLEMTWQSTQALGRTLSVALEHPSHINDGTQTYGDLTGPSPLIVYASEAKIQNVTEENDEDDCVESKCNFTTRVFAAANFTELDWPTDPPTAPVFGQMHERLLDAGFVLDQKFTQYLTSFHFQQKPDAFTALPNA